MATRSLATKQVKTSQPDVECHMCRRRLLRGEQPDVFIVGAQRRVWVCELCAPRAAQEGWLRETEAHLLSRRPPRVQRGRTLLDRLRALREAYRPTSLADPDAAPPPSGEPFDLLDGGRSKGGERSLSFLEESFTEAPAEAQGSSAASIEEESAATLVSVEADHELLEGVGLFNLSEHPRRIAGVARSLGQPSVNVRRSAEHPACISIVVAWELCWYRYEAQLEHSTVGMVAQGMELEQLADEDRQQNAAADEHGALALLP